MLFRSNPKLAPYQVAVLPLSKQLAEEGEEVLSIINRRFDSVYDVTGSIGKRYRREDAIGTPFCVTIDFDTKEDKCVTVRERDSMKQERVKISSLCEYIQNKIESME